MYQDIYDCAIIFCMGMMVGVAALGYYYATRRRA